MGLVDPSGYIDQSRIASDESSQFLAAKFVQNPTIDFPDYTPGVVYQRPVTPDSAGFTLLLSGSHGLADTPGRAYSELADVYGEGRGLFAAAAGAWTTGGSRTLAGLWISTARHDRFDGGRPESNNGAYVVRGLDTRIGTFSLRAGMANPRVALAHLYLSLAYQRRWPGAVLGLGLAGIGVSRHAPDPAADGLNAEVYIRINLVPGVLLTPSLQYLRHPTLDGSGAVVDRDLGIAAMRLTWLW